jgi:hypothetical protein
MSLHLAPSELGAFQALRLKCAGYGYSLRAGAAEWPKREANHRYLYSKGGDCAPKNIRGLRVLFRSATGNT